MSIARRKILLTGRNGQVGWELERSLQPLGQVFAFGHAGMDLANPDSIRRVIREVKPDLIVNAAAYTAVDKAESEPDLAMAVNGVAPGIMAEEAKRLGAAFIHYSTDYVFDGSKTEPYTEDDEPNPINVYGKTKLAGERAIQAVGVPHLIFRTSWMYGVRGQNFLLTILRLAEERDELRIVDDQQGSPTWCRVAAEVTTKILSAGNIHIGHAKDDSVRLSGIYHLACRGSTSRYDFAKAALTATGTVFKSADDRNDNRLPKTCDLVPIDTGAYPLPARRPQNSALDSTRLERKFSVALPARSASLHDCLKGHC